MSKQVIRQAIGLQIFYANKEIRYQQGNSISGLMVSNTPYENVVGHDRKRDIYICSVLTVSFETECNDGNARSEKEQAKKETEVDRRYYLK